MFLVYNILILLLIPLLVLYFVVFLFRRKDFRAGFRERLGKVPRQENGRRRTPGLSASFHEPVCFWVHAVSVGEVMAAAPLVKGLRLRFPSSRIIFSMCTPTGREAVKARCPEVDSFFYFPLDVYPIVEKVICKIRPTLFLLVETDIWPVFLHSLAQKKIPALLLNGRISSRRLLLRFFYRKVLTQFRYLCMQTDSDAERLLSLGISPERVQVTGNMKFAQAVSREGNPVQLKRELRLPDNAVLLIAGSTHSGEEEEMIRCYRGLATSLPDLLLLVAPRHPDRFDEVEALFSGAGLSCVRRSQGKPLAGYSVVLLDTLGELSDVYALGTFVFVGGSWVRRGGHNVMEPAAWGKPIFFGPHMDNYSAIAASLEKAGAAIRVRDGEDLAGHIQRLSQDGAQVAEMGRRAAAFVSQHQGAVEKNLDVVEKVVSCPPFSQP